MKDEAMSVEIFEVANGWVVRPRPFGRDNGMICSPNEHVFNSFDELVKYLRSLSPILKKQAAA
jgi:hypothetical protein